MDRAFQQYLESLKRGGLKHVPRAVEPLEQFTILREGEPDTTSTAETQPPAEEPFVVTQAAVPVTPTGAVSAEAAGQASLFSPEAEGVQSPSDASLEVRREKLALVAQQVAACERCDELVRNRTQTVFGVGNPAAEVMFIGEAPGADEDRLGEPFVGKAGQLLDKIITACQLTREEIYICNILRCRPPGNRNPKPDEARNCREYLDAQIETVDPDYIVCWGKIAAQSLLGLDGSIGRMRGRWYKYGRAKVLCTYHPSYLLRQESAKKEVWKDMKFFRAAMGVDLG